MLGSKYILLPIIMVQIYLNLFNDKYNRLLNTHGFSHGSPDWLWNAGMFLCVFSVRFNFVFTSAPCKYHPTPVRYYIILIFYFFNNFLKFKISVLSFCFVLFLRRLLLRAQEPFGGGPGCAELVVCCARFALLAVR